MFLGSLMIAFKFTHDNCYKIKYWAEWSNLSKAEIIALELKTLQALGYELIISHAEFEQWAQVYSERCNQPNHTSLFAAVVLYLFAMRRMHSTDIATQPRAPTPRHLDRSDFRLSFDYGECSRPSSPDSAIGSSEAPTPDAFIAAERFPAFNFATAGHTPTIAHYPTGVFVPTAPMFAIPQSSAMHPQRHGHRYEPYARCPPADEASHAIYPQLNSSAHMPGARIVKGAYYAHKY
jgi:hypothetical protein